MPVRLIFADQATGVVTQPSGEWAFGEPPYIGCEGMAEALTLAESCLQDHGDYEAWIGTSQTSYRITIPSQSGFMPWMDAYHQHGSLGSIQLGQSFGKIISMLGFPNQCSMSPAKSPLAVVFRYLPGSVDFHFDAEGRLWLVHDDSLDAPHTLLSR